VTIKLPDVLLRSLEKQDADRLYTYRNDPATTAMLGGFSAGYSRDDMRDWIEFHRATKNEVLWAIADLDDDSCIGHVGLYQVDHRIRKAEFAILIGDPDRRGTGIGKSVTSAVIEYGFAQLNLHRIELTVLAFNEPAIRLYEGLGFVKEGVQRDAQYRDGTYHDVILMAIFDDQT